MHGDYTRLHFDSGGRLYTRVRQLQGRLALDADWNTHVELQHRLDAATRIDVIGECGYPEGGTGFNATAATSGTLPDLILEPGRFYAHGLVLDLPAAVRYSQQPFRRKPLALAPPTGGAGKQVVYLEVWERHVTAIEDPTILEPALDGRDTASRVQTVWQVKVGVAGATDTCATAAPPAVGPGTGKLTTSSVTPPPTTDPCLIDAKGGFRGLDNRLYRVEVHSAGALGTATFKWSRDNGSVVYPLSVAPTASASASGTTVTALVPVPPRDELLALHAGEWVELLDDETEFDGAAGPLLKLAQDPIAGPTGVTLTLEFPSAVALPSGANLKVRRWDGPTGAVATAAGPLDLGDGVRVAFSAGAYQVGDFWTFTARANGGVVEQLTTALPQGVRRHVCKLAVLTWAAGAITNVEDCRKPFPPLTNLPKGGNQTGNRGCCTITVGDGTTSTGDFKTLQEAIAEAHARDGPVRVCVLPGVHRVDEPVEITRRDAGDLSLTGCGLQSRVEAKDQVLIVRGATDVVIENIQISGNRPVTVVAKGPGAPAERVTVRRCRLDGGEWALRAQAKVLDVVENVCTGGIGIGESSRDVLIEDNEVAGGGFGVGFGPIVVPELDPLEGAAGIERVAVRGNAFRWCRYAGVGAIAELRADPPPTVTDLDVVGNRVSECGWEPFKDWPATGIAVLRAARVRIADNNIRDCGRLSEKDELFEKAPACGVLVAEVGHVAVTGNTVIGNGLTKDASKGLQGGIVVLGAIGGLPVVPTEKEVPTRFGPLLVDPGAPAARVCDNRVVCPQGPALLLTGFGPAAITGNTLVSIGTYNWPKDRAEPFATTTDDLTALSNSAVAVGPLRKNDDGKLREALEGDGRLLVEGNQVTLHVSDRAEALKQGAYFQWTLDLGLSNNQFLVRTSKQQLGVHVRVVADTIASTVRIIGNRVTEVPKNKGVSVRVEVVEEKETVLTPVIVALNQTTNRVEVGTKTLTAAPNPADSGNQRDV